MAFTPEAKQAIVAVTNVLGHEPGVINEGGYEAESNYNFATRVAIEKTIEALEGDLSAVEVLSQIQDDLGLSPNEAPRTKDYAKYLGILQGSAVMIDLWRGKPPAQ